MSKIALVLAILLSACCGTAHETTSMDSGPSTVVQDSGSDASSPVELDAGPKPCTITICGVVRDLCESSYGEVQYPDAGVGEAMYCSTSDEGTDWLTCCAAYCDASHSEGSFQYECGRTSK